MLVACTPRPAASGRSHPVMPRPRPLDLPVGENLHHSDHPHDNLRTVPSGRKPPVVFLLQAAPAFPEWRGLVARGAGDKNIEVHVPAGADLEHGRAVGQTAMGHGEQHALTPWLQFEGDVAAVIPGEGKLARRIEFGDPALHAVLFGEAGRTRAWRVAEFIVAPDQFEGRADL